MFDIKKLVLVSSVLLPSLATANIVSGISYKGYIGSNETPDASAYEVTLGTNIMKNLDVDLRTEFVDYNDSSVNGNRLEVGLTPSYKFTDYPVGVYGRVALGNQWFSGNGILKDSDTFGYGSVEPGVFYTPWKDNVTGASIGYRYRGAFNDQPFYNSNALLMKGVYEIDRHNSLNLGYEYVASADDAEIASNVITVGYNARF